jgi:hypothetical protein
MLLAMLAQARARGDEDRSRSEGGSGSGDEWVITVAVVDMVTKTGGIDYSELDLGRFSLNSALMQR